MLKNELSPLEKSFIVSAPAKVIVFGEHGAVYGKPAIAAAISLRSYLHVQTLPASEHIVALDFREIDLYYTWSIDTLPWPPSDSRLRKCHGSSLDGTLLAAIEPLVEAVSPDLPQKERKIHQGSARVFLYLFLSLGSPESPGAVYTLRSAIPVGAGLGSSASVSICISTALLIQANALEGPSGNREDQLQRINNWAYAGELCIHGDPSGVDNTISCLGQAVLFCKTTDGLLSVKPLHCFPELRILLIDTKRTRTTADQVRKVRQLKEANPANIEPILDAIGLLVEEALHFLSSTATSFNDSEERQAAIENLGRLFGENQKLLNSLEVSHPCLDRVVQLADITKVGWAKLTGAGGGGCAIVLLHPDVSENALRRFDQEIANEGFEKHQVILGAAGVAVRGCSLVGDEVEGGIDRGEFANEDICTIEQLVGLAGNQLEMGEGWISWR
ncbi:Mevalonate kinase [Ophidiomyces ophidiicola]|nr:Mevalonate kinase [Ophidiomyces ophidiicola]KAI1949572.1 Mevalonate kinase [Ophidiomyces ophidiicola]KAI1968636.1 Mevalonate kinase [Ophidiomyces ophidiicola]KAI2021098.1 Mevalonate kinase [Ophidiomyces ophidiicola]KAI2032793.1 Mevalonate kinase [Ophidiomyces ophidiicola]